MLCGEEEARCAGWGLDGPGERGGGRGRLLLMGDSLAGAAPWFGSISDQGLDGSGGPAVGDGWCNAGWDEGALHLYASEGGVQ